MRPIFWLLVAGLLLYEAAALANANNHDTITEIIKHATLTRPIIPFVAGLLAGHLFWT